MNFMALRVLNSSEDTNDWTDKTWHPLIQKTGLHIIFGRLFWKSPYIREQISRPIGAQEWGILAANLVFGLHQHIQIGTGKPATTPSFNPNFQCENPLATALLDPSYPDGPELEPDGRLSITYRATFPPETITAANKIEIREVALFDGGQPAACLAYGQMAQPVLITPQDTVQILFKLTGAFAVGGVRRRRRRRTAYKSRRKKTKEAMK